MIRYGINLPDLPDRVIDAVEMAERNRAATVILRDGAAVAAIVPSEELDRLNPADPGASGGDPLLALCGSCAHDAFADEVVRAGAVRR